MYFVLISSRYDVTPAQKGILAQYFYAGGQTLKIGKIAKFEPLKVHEDQIFEL
jgi:hypothetical protein